MFKNITPLSVAVPAALTADALAQALANFPFEPCGTTQPESAGWVPPRGVAHGALVEAIAGAWFLRFVIEKKPVPSAAITKRVDELAAKLEDERGYKPGKRERKELREQAVLELLPQAFAKRVAVNVVLFPRGGFVLLDTSSTSIADYVITALVRLPLDQGLICCLLQPAQSPAGCMAAWLAEGAAPSGFYLDRECTLKSADEMRSVVRYTRKALDTDEVKAHIATGMRPQALALSYGDRAAFVLTPGLVLKKFELLDVAMEGRADVEENEAFDADGAIFAGEALPLLRALIDAMGGLADVPAPAFSTNNEETAEAL